MTDPSQPDPTATEETLPAARPPLALEVVPFLERKIISREMAPGMKLVETELCERYRISRSPMREALRLLEASGLVVRRPRYGVRVAPMTIENLDHVYACRQPLEALAAAAIAGVRNRDIAANALAACVEQMQASVDAGDVEGSFHANVELTDVLHQATPNPVLVGLLDQVNKPALRYRHLAYLESPTIIPMSIEANWRMIEAIRRGDPVQAEQVTQDLVQNAWLIVREVFAERHKG